VYYARIPMTPMPEEVAVHREKTITTMTGFGWLFPNLLIVLCSDHATQPVIIAGASS